MQRQPDITKARDTLGWEPKVEMRVGLEATIAYFSELVKSGLVDLYDQDGAAG